jgi:beta-ureidopropionase
MHAGLCITQAQDFDLRSALFRAAPEQLRPPRLLRIGLIQHGIVLPTDAPFAQQTKVGPHGSCGTAGRVVREVPTRASAPPYLSPPLSAQAIHDRVAQLLDAAGQGGAKVVCLEEAW